jgi:putative tricarboxylic transport membrane protein
VLGILMVSLGIILCAQAIYQTSKSVVPASSEWKGEARKIFRAFGLLIIGVIYLFMLAFLGYVLSIALLLAAVAFYLGAAFNWRMMLIAAAGAVVLWTIFVILLGVPMPAGLFSQG